MTTDHAVADDGSPVEVYLNLATEPEFTPLLARLRPPGRVLDLGCGVGRLANRLAGDGFNVTGVDDSADMLAHLSPEVTPVQAGLETLTLSAAFDHVVMASHLINVADAMQRGRFLSAAARHLAPGGRLYIEHYDVARMRDVTVAEGRSGKVTTRFEIVDRDRDRFRGRATYRLGETVWTQEFSAELLDAPAMHAALSDAGLEVVEHATSTWTVARLT